MFCAWQDKSGGMWGRLMHGLYGTLMGRVLLTRFRLWMQRGR